MKLVRSRLLPLTLRPSLRPIVTMSASTSNQSKVNRSAKVVLSSMVVVSRSCLFSMYLKFSCVSPESLMLPHCCPTNNLSVSLAVTVVPLTRVTAPCLAILLIINGMRSRLLPATLAGKAGKPRVMLSASWSAQKKVNRSANVVLSMMVDPS